MSRMPNDREQGELHSDSEALRSNTAAMAFTTPSNRSIPFSERLTISYRSIAPPLIAHNLYYVK